MDRPYVFEDFADKVGHGFTIAVDDGVPPVAATLIEAERLSAGRTAVVARPPFSLVFLAEHAAALPQRLYRLEHAQLGALSMFLVPIARDPRGVSYQAMFN